MGLTLAPCDSYPKESAELPGMAPTAHFEWRPFCCLHQAMSLGSLDQWAWAPAAVALGRRPGYARIATSSTLLTPPPPPDGAAGGGSRRWQLRRGDVAAILLQTVCGDGGLNRRSFEALCSAALDSGAFVCLPEFFGYGMQP